MIKNQVPSMLQNSDVEKKALEDTIKAMYDA